MGQRQGPACDQVRTQCVTRVRFQRVTRAGAQDVTGIRGECVTRLKAQCVARMGDHSGTSIRDSSEEAPGFILGQCQASCGFPFESCLYFVL